MRLEDFLITSLRDANRSDTFKQEGCGVQADGADRAKNTIEHRHFTYS